MEVDIKSTENNPDSSKVMQEKPSSPKSTSSDSAQTRHPPPHSASSSSTELNQEKDLNETDIKEEEGESEDARKGTTNDVNMDVDPTKLKTKTVKMETLQAEMSTRPSSTPPSVTGMCKLIEPHKNLTSYFILADILKAINEISVKALV